MDNHCNQCGMCCRAIPLQKSMNEVKEIAEKQRNHIDAHFVLENWEEITFEEARAINKDIGRNIPEIIAEKVERFENYYRCKAYVNGKCTKYEERPPVCKKYPYNGHIESLQEDFSIYSLINATTCGFVPFARENKARYGKMLSNESNLIVEFKKTFKENNFMYETITE